MQHVEGWIRLVQLLLIDGVANRALFIKTGLEKSKIIRNQWLLLLIWLHKQINASRWLVTGYHGRRPLFEDFLKAGMDGRIV